MAVRVLVTGGTGFIGGAVVRELVGRGHAVRVCARPASDAAAVEAAGAEVVRAELHEAGAVRRALDGCEAVVHCAGRAGLRPGPGAELRAADVDAADVVLGAAREAGVARAVFTSSTAVQGGGRTPAVVDEAGPGNAESLGIPCFTSKQAGERVARAHAGRGLPLVILRPACVLGPGDVRGAATGVVVALAHRRIPGFVDGGASYCDVRDVARAHGEALERGTAGAVYTLGGHNLTNAELVARVCALAGVAPPRKMAYSAAMAIAAAEEITASLQRRRAAITRDLIRASALYTFASAERAGADLGYTLLPFDESVLATLRWAVAAGELAPDTDALRALAAG